MVLTNTDKMKKSSASEGRGKKLSGVKKGGKGLLQKRESIKEFAVRTKVKYASCMDLLLEGDQLKDGELNNLCCINTHEQITNFDSTSSKNKDQHLYELFRQLEGCKSYEYMRQWLGFFLHCTSTSYTIQGGLIYEPKKDGNGRLVEQC